MDRRAILTAYALGAASVLALGVIVAEWAHADSVTPDLSGLAASLATVQQTAQSAQAQAATAQTQSTAAQTAATAAQTQATTAQGAATSAQTAATNAASAAGTAQTTATAAGTAATAAQNTATGAATNAAAAQTATAALQSTMAAVQAGVAPCTAAPLPDTLAGAIGTATPCMMRPDAVRPTVVQASNVVTDSNGLWSVTFAKAFTTAVPVVNPLPVNSGTLPIMCNVIARSATAANGKCWQATTNTLGGSLTAIVGAVINVFSNAASGTAVMVVARDPTQ